MTVEEPRPQRVFLVDDHPIVREGLKRVLAREGTTVCGEARSCHEALERLAGGHPDAVLVELAVGREDTFDLITELASRGLPVVVFSAYEDPQHIERAFAAGARGYVTKQEDPKVLVRAVRAVAAGGRFVSGPAVQNLLREHSGKRLRPPEQPLSDREREVLVSLGQGDVTAEIARKLHLSPRTIETYYARVALKLGLTGMRELRRHAIQRAREPFPS